MSLGCDSFEGVLRARGPHFLPTEMKLFSSGHICHSLTKFYQRVL